MDIYITDLSAYNEGFLVGKWIQLPLQREELSDALYETLRRGEEVANSSNHEEIFITDYESQIVIREHDDIDRLNELAEVMQGYSEDDLFKLQVLSDEGYNERDCIDNGLNTYDVEIYDYRENTSFTDTFELLAQDFVNDGIFGEIPKAIENYIDYESIAIDLRFDYTEIETNVIGRVN